jgi:hypothetical protein
MSFPRRPSRTDLLVEIIRRARTEHGPEWRVEVDTTTPPLIEVRVFASGDRMRFEVDEREPEANLRRKVGWAFEQFGHRMDAIAAGRLAPQEAEA